MTAPNAEYERPPKYILLGTLNGPARPDGRKYEVWACGDCGCAVGARMVHDQVCVGEAAQIDRSVPDKEA